MSPSYLARVLSGQRRPLLGTAQGLAKACGLTLDEFTRLLTLAVESKRRKAKAGRKR